MLSIATSKVTHDQEVCILLSNRLPHSKVLDVHTYLHNMGKSVDYNILDRPFNRKLLCKYRSKYLKDGCMTNSWPGKVFDYGSTCLQHNIQETTCTLEVKLPVLVYISLCPSRHAA